MRLEFNKLLFCFFILFASIACQQKATETKSEEEDTTRVVKLLPNPIFPSPIEFALLLKRSGIFIEHNKQFSDSLTSVSSFPLELTGMYVLEMTISAAQNNSVQLKNYMRIIQKISNENNLKIIKDEVKFSQKLESENNVDSLIWFCFDEFSIWNPELYPEVFYGQSLEKLHYLFILSKKLNGFEKIFDRFFDERFYMNYVVQNLRPMSVNMLKINSLLQNIPKITPAHSTKEVNGTTVICTDYKTDFTEEGLKTLEKLSVLVEKERNKVLGLKK